MALRPTDEPVAIVTGGSRQIARDLGRRGYAVVVAYLAGQAEVEALLAAGDAALAVRADVRDQLDVERLFDETVAAFGRVDLVVLTAPYPLVAAQAARHGSRVVDQGVPGRDGERDPGPSPP